MNKHIKFFSYIDIFLEYSSIHICIALLWSNAPIAPNKFSDVGVHIHVPWIFTYMSKFTFGIHICREDFHIPDLIFGIFIYSHFIASILKYTHNHFEAFLVFNLLGFDSLCILISQNRRKRNGKRFEMYIKIKCKLKCQCQSFQLSAIFLWSVHITQKNPETGNTRPV